MKQGQFLEDKLYPLLMELANQTADPMIMLDDTFHILIFNKHVETLFSFPAKKALGLTLNEMCALSNIKCFISDEIMKSLPTSNIPSLFHHKKILWQLKKIPVDNTNFFLLKANRRDEKYYLRWSRYLVIDFSHPWLKSTRQRAKCLTPTVLRPARCAERASVCLPQ